MIPSAWTLCGHSDYKCCSAFSFFVRSEVLRKYTFECSTTHPGSYRMIKNRMRLLFAIEIASMMLRNVFRCVRLIFIRRVIVYVTVFIPCDCFSPVNSYVWFRSTSPGIFLRGDAGKALKKISRCCFQSNIVFFFYYLMNLDIANLNTILSSFFFKFIIVFIFPFHLQVNGCNECRTKALWLNYEIGQTTLSIFLYFHYFNAILRNLRRAFWNLERFLVNIVCMYIYILNYFIHKVSVQVLIHLSGVQKTDYFWR